MKLPPRALGLKRLILKDKPVLALDTGFDADSLEGLRLVKASRGSGWFYDGTSLKAWTTKGVLQEDKRLWVWGDLDPVPEGSDVGAWPLEGPEGRSFVRAFAAAWAARAAAPSDPLPAFSPTALVPWKTGDHWCFAFPPSDLRGTLDSLLPLSERLAWEHFRHPEAAGAASWAFTSAALAVQVASGELPWTQGDEEHLRQEIRELKRTFSDDELPLGIDTGTARLWSDSLTSRLGTDGAARWAAWVREDRPWEGGADSARAQKREAALLRRQKRRSGAAFWRRKGTLITALGAGAVILAALVGSVVWGVLKPDPTDEWGPEQVVRGYYAALSDLDADLMRKITSFDAGKQKDLDRDQTEVTNLYVIRQVRIAYERQSPVTSAQSWESAGRPALTEGQMLYGVAGLEVEGAEAQWTVRYRKWVSEADEAQKVQAVGAQVTDQLQLTKTGKGWKISSLQRDRRPLP